MDSAVETKGVYATLADLVRMRHRARGFSFLPKQPVQSLLAGRHASRLRGRGLNFEEIRKYLPGDDIRQIDWKVTARTRKPHARVYTEERERPVILLVDQRLGMFFGSQRNLKSVTACELAALAAWRTIDVQDRVGAVVFNDSQAISIRPQRSQAAVMRILQQVLEMNRQLHASAQARPNPAMFNEALRRARQLAPHDSLVMMITDGDGGDDETQRLVTEIARHNDVVLAFVFDPLEADLPELSQVVISDGHQQLELDSSNAEFRTRYQDDFAGRRKQGKHFLLTREVPVLPISAAEPTLDQLAKLLGRPGRAR